jgi:hypothetical protein
MRILDQDSDKATSNVLLLLTSQEASELRDELERLLQSGHDEDHGHIDDRDYEHEITIVLYTDDKTSKFNERVKKLINQDE